MFGYRLSTLFLDCDSFFASTEQQLRPDLRGRPVGVIPVVSTHTCCIAASYEAKAKGVRTGTPVLEARARCPDIVFVRSRPPAYLEMHHKVLDAVREIAEVRSVHSIDEMSCRTPRSMRTPEGAEILAREVKASIRARVGEFVRCSVGVGPNTLLAKTAAEMRKPDGLVVLDDADIPGAIAHLPIEDIPGIGRRMGPRLRAAGIDTVRALYERSEDDLAAAWNGVVGRRMWMWLHGMDPPLPRTVTRSVGHQHVLPWDLRAHEPARGVMLRLLTKALMRALHMRAAPTRLIVSAQPDREAGQRVSLHAPLPEGCADFPVAMRAASDLWASLPRTTFKWVGVTLADLVPLGSATAPLFAEERRGAGIAGALYAVNSRHGRNALLPASTLDAKDDAPGGIAFHVVPDRSFFDGPSMQPRSDRAVSTRRPRSPSR
ncbi:MAG: DNA polymerase Y family protein [Phycisphaerales bacterium]